MLSPVCKNSGSCSSGSISQSAGRANAAAVSGERSRAARRRGRARRRAWRGQRGGAQSCSLLFASVGMAVDLVSCTGSGVYRSAERANARGGERRGLHHKTTFIMRPSYFAASVGIRFFWPTLLFPPAPASRSAMYAGVPTAFFFSSTAPRSLRRHDGVPVAMVDPRSQQMWCAPARLGPPRAGRPPPARLAEPADRLPPRRVPEREHVASQPPQLGSAAELRRPGRGGGRRGERGRHAPPPPPARAARPRRGPRRCRAGGSGASARRASRHRPPRSILRHRRRRARGLGARLCGSRLELALRLAENALGLAHPRVPPVVRQPPVRSHGVCPPAGRCPQALDEAIDAQIVRRRSFNSAPPISTPIGGGAAAAGYRLRVARHASSVATAAPSPSGSGSLRQRPPSPPPCSRRPCPPATAAPLHQAPPPPARLPRRRRAPPLAGRGRRVGARGIRASAPAAARRRRLAPLVRHLRALALLRRSSARSPPWGVVVAGGVGVVVVAFGMIGGPASGKIESRSSIACVTSASLSAAVAAFRCAYASNSAFEILPS